MLQYFLVRIPDYFDPSVFLEGAHHYFQDNQWLCQQLNCGTVQLLA